VADPVPADYRMRQPCVACGCLEGYIIEKNGQACVYCSGCNRHQYNAPKAERGLAPQPVRSGPVSPALRYRVFERAGFRCELCGRDPATHAALVMHVAHLVSEKDVRSAGLPLDLADDMWNLACLCDECNLGMGSHSMPLNQVLIHLIRRQRGLE
jgi:hypothetical protein